ncbi:hypothetical protein [Streptomyces sp. NPDC020298]|uniref:hypothetical protein n=1 Tax=unclassified Streptomyces TaxID=2593676 RepID=UPI0033DE1219
MRLASGSRIILAGGATLLASGLGLGAIGVTGSDASRSLGGTCLVTAALTMIALTLIHHWVVDTSVVRRELVRSLGEVEAERRRYTALQGALEAEATRLTRDLNEERAAVTATLYAERAAMQKKFEEQRLQLAGEAFRTGVQMERSGMLKPDEPVPANLIQFPEHGQMSRSPERSREHGGVAP